MAHLIHHISPKALNALEDHLKVRESKLTEFGWELPRSLEDMLKLLRETPMHKDSAQGL